MFSVCASGHLHGNLAYIQHCFDSLNIRHQNCYCLAHRSDLVHFKGWQYKAKHTHNTNIQTHNTRTPRHPDTHTQTHAHMHRAYTHAHAHVHTHTHTSTPSPSAPPPPPTLTIVHCRRRMDPGQCGGGKALLHWAAGANSKVHQLLAQLLVVWVVNHSVNHRD